MAENIMLNSVGAIHNCDWPRDCECVERLSTVQYSIHHVVMQMSHCAYKISQAAEYSHNLPKTFTADRVKGLGYVKKQSCIGL